MRVYSSILAATAMTLAASTAMATTSDVFHYSNGAITVDGDKTAATLNVPQNLAAMPAITSWVNSAIKTVTDGQAWSPFAGATGDYLAVGINGGTYGEAVWEFGKNTVLNTLSFYWGSFDGYLNPAGRNTVTFWKGGTQVGAVDGQDLTSTMTSAGFSAGASQNSVFKAVFTVAGGFDKVVFSSTAQSFETSRIAFENKNVPGPIAGAGLPFLIAGAAMWMRRRNGRIA